MQAVGLRHAVWRACWLAAVALVASVTAPAALAQAK